MKGKGKLDRRDMPMAVVLEAELVAEDLLCLHMSSPAKVSIALQQQYNMSEASANQMVKTVRQKWQRDAREVRPERRREITLAIERQYRKADEEGDRPTALQALKLLASLEGYLVQRHKVQDDRQPTQDEFEGKSARELDHYATHGVWPAELAAN